MTIAVCDDNGLFLEYFSKMVGEYLASRSIHANILMYNNGNELLQSDIGQLDVVFLDIHIAELNGIQVANILRHKNPKFILVFITSFMEYATEGYEPKALRYILKENISELFLPLMNAVLLELGYFRKEITFDFVYGSETVFADNIVYLESTLHKVLFHFSAGKEQRHIYRTLDAVESMLPEDDFVRIHKSYLVNQKYFLYIRESTAILENNIQLPISQKQYTETKKRLFAFKGKVW